MATSIGAAAAQGIESGFGLGLRAVEQQDRKRQRERDEQLQDVDRAERQADRGLQLKRFEREDQRTAEQDARQRRLDQIKLLDDEIGMIRSEGEELLKQYGAFDKIPGALRDDFTTRSRTKRGERNKVRSEFFRPSVADQKRSAAETWSRIEAGQMQIEDIDDDDLVKTLTVQTRRSLQDFLDGPDGSPSVIRQGALDFEAGLATGNEDLMLKGVNTLLMPELMTGVGDDGLDGNEIIGKRIIKLLPHPQKEGEFVPLLEVKVRRPDGAVGVYRAPVTEDRSGYFGNAEAMPKSISLQDGFDRVGQLNALAAALNRPDLRKRIEAGQKKAGAAADEFLQQLYGIGGSVPERKVTRDKLDLGGRVIEREVDANGKIVGQQEYSKTAVPRQFSSYGLGGGGRRATGLAGLLETIDDQVDDGLIGEDEGEDLKRAAVSKAAGKGGGAPAKPLPVAALKLQQEELDAIALSGSISADLEALVGLIDRKKLDLGPVANVVSRGRNVLGVSDQNSRNFQSFQATLEKLRNDSLRLNKGVQTEGDAVRAWNEVVTNINDPKVVKQRLLEIKKINERAADLRRLNVETIRSNFGQEPLDTDRRFNQAPAIGAGQGQPPASFKARGQNDGDVYRQAAEALRGGRDPAGVAKKLRQMGYSAEAVDELIEGAR